MLHTFRFDTQSHAINFVESYRVKNGVTCDVYTFRDDTSKDLAIITISAGSCTPRQRVVAGEETIEGRLSGQGTLTIWRDGMSSVYDTGTPQRVIVGEEMQWQATGHGNLICYEICTPPYSDGRFIDLD
ncbi:MAG TPA: hypothetical protein VFQ70_04260 [Candidatus Saccharimonadaceae bacterium]|nr:hypothetical protein [Candidatus Saccharimonadaceae bacterium]